MQYVLFGFGELKSQDTQKRLNNWKIQLKIGFVMNNTEMVTNFVVKKQLKLILILSFQVFNGFFAQQIYNLHPPKTKNRLNITGETKKNNIFPVFSCFDLMNNYLKFSSVPMKQHTSLFLETIFLFLRETIYELFITPETVCSDAGYQ